MMGGGTTTFSGLLHRAPSTAASAGASTGAGSGGVGVLRAAAADSSAR